MVEVLTVSQDIEATCRALRALGVAIEATEGSDESRRTYRIERPGQLNLQEPVIDMGESGSTLRFLVPLCLLGELVTILGRRRLISRPLEAYYRIFDDQAIEYGTEEGRLPIRICGRLNPGLFRIPGDVSSQFVGGLLFALPGLSGDSQIEVTSDLESRG